MIDKSLDLTYLFDKRCSESQLNRFFNFSTFPFSSVLLLENYFCANSNSKNNRRYLSLGIKSSDIALRKFSSNSVWSMNNRWRNAQYRRQLLTHGYQSICIGVYILHVHECLRNRIGDSTRTWRFVGRLCIRSHASIHSSNIISVSCISANRRYR